MWLCTDRLKFWLMGRIVWRHINRHLYLRHFYPILGSLKFVISDLLMNTILLKYVFLSIICRNATGCAWARSGVRRRKQRLWLRVWGCAPESNAETSSEFRSDRVRAREVFPSWPWSGWCVTRSAHGEGCKGFSYFKRLSSLAILWILCK